MGTPNVLTNIWFCVNIRDVLIKFDLGRHGIDWRYRSSGCRRAARSTGRSEWFVFGRELANVRLCFIPVKFVNLFDRWAPQENLVLPVNPVCREKREDRATQVRCRDRQRYVRCYGSRVRGPDFVAKLIAKTLFNNCQEYKSKCRGPTLNVKECK